MNPLRDLPILDDLARERQAQMRREARIAYELRGRMPNRTEGNAVLKQKLFLVLVGALLAALLIAQLAAAAGAGGGAGRYLLM